MASFHLELKKIRRSLGQNAVRSAAYRAGVILVDEFTSRPCDYRRKTGVTYSRIILPPDAPSWASNRSRLWNEAERAEKRTNSVVAREFVIALPHELWPWQRRRLALRFAREIAARHGCAVDVCIHAPNRRGDQRNHHAHLLLTTRRLTVDGFMAKTREFDKVGCDELAYWRERFAGLQNEHLMMEGRSAQVDHRSLPEQGIARTPTRHLGPAAIGFERRTEEDSDRRLVLLFDADDQRLMAEALAVADKSPEVALLHTELESLHKSLEEAKSIYFTLWCSQLARAHGWNTGEDLTVQPARRSQLEVLAQQSVETDPSWRSTQDESERPDERCVDLARSEDAYPSEISAMQPRDGDGGFFTTLRMLALGEPKAPLADRKELVEDVPEHRSAAHQSTDDPDVASLVASNGEDSSLTLEDAGVEAMHWEDDHHFQGTSDDQNVEDDYPESEQSVHGYDI